MGSSAGFKVVHQAAFYGCGMPVLTMLAGKGGNFLERTTDGRTPAEVARARGKVRCAANIEGLVNGETNSEGVPERYLCPVNQDFMTEPVAVVSGHVFQREAIACWIAARGNGASGPVPNPMTNLPLANLTLTPKPELQAEIRAFLDANPTLSDN